MKTLALCALLFGCANPPSAKAVETDLCNARALYKVSTDGSLDPEPGSPRAKLEAAEDAFCATLAK